MGYLKVNQEKVTDDIADKLLKICPFQAIERSDDKIVITAGCKMCKICVNKGPIGVIEYIEEHVKSKINKNEWNGIAVFVELLNNSIHPVTFELIGKAKELAKEINHKIYAVIIGYQTDKKVEELKHYGIDNIYVYDNENLKEFKIMPYSNALEDFIKKIKPSSILVGATNLGRSLAPRVAARFRTGLTADCTSLEMKENTDLVQIRPAFGGNIMAQIINSNNRPQFCTVRYKVFTPPVREGRASGKIIQMELSEERLHSDTKVYEIIKNEKVLDISEADTLIAVGRGIKTKEELDMIKELAKVLRAEIACTRPFVEMGWMSPKRQIGLSGRTVKAKLIIAIGISGAVQFSAGMRNSECIVAVNKDKMAPIFNIAHFGLVGDLNDVIPKLRLQLKQRI